MRKFILILLTAALCFVSCQRINWAIGKRISGLNSISKFEHPESGKKVTFIGIRHIGTVRYFEEIKNYLDSLRNDGYVVFFELIMDTAPGTTMDTLAVRTAFRKYRRLHGWIPINSEQKGYEWVTKNKGERPGEFVQQSLERLGLSFEQDEWCDMTVSEIIERYEAKYGEIILTQCDWDIPLGDEYKCRTEQTFDTWYAKLTLRDENVAKRVAESEHRKIVILYGGRHMFTMDTNLYQHGFVCTDWLISEAKKK